MSTAAFDDRARTVTRPSLAAAADAVSDALLRGALVTVVGRCTVEYEGRAASTLGPGDRHLMIKPDGTVMIHTDEGRQPVNWQPPGCTSSVERDDDRLVISSTRSSPDEELHVRFGEIVQVSAFDLTDEAELALSGTHEDLKRRVVDDPALIEPGFTPLATERETSAGAVDVYGEDADEKPVVLELKRSRAGPDAASQLERYVDALREDAEVDAAVRGILVAPSATDRTHDLLAERDLEFAAVSPEGE